MKSFTLTKNEKQAMGIVFTVMAVVITIIIFAAAAEAEIIDGGYVTTSTETVEVECLKKNAGYSHKLTAIIGEPNVNKREVFLFDSSDEGEIANLGELAAGSTIEFRLDVTEGRCKFDRKAYRTAKKAAFLEAWKLPKAKFQKEWRSYKKKYKGKKYRKARRNKLKKIRNAKRAAQRAVWKNATKGFKKTDYMICTERTYFSDSSFNEDGFDHMRIVDAEFGFEDMWGGGDQDFNDCTFKIHGNVVAVDTGDLEEVAEELEEEVVKLNHKDCVDIIAPVVFATTNTDGNGLYFVGDEEENSVSVVDPEGVLQDQYYGVKDNANFNNFRDIQLGPHDGNLYVVMDDEWQLIVIQPDGTFVGKFRNKSGSAGSVVAMDMNSTHMYFVKYNETNGESFIDKYVVERYYRDTIALGQIKVTDIAVASDGICYSTSDGVTKIDFDGNELWSIPTGAQYLAANEDSLFMSGDGTIISVDLQYGEEELNFETPNFNTADLDVTVPNQIHVLDKTGMSDGSGTFMHNYSF